MDNWPCILGSRCYPWRGLGSHTHVYAPYIIYITLITHFVVIEYTWCSLVCSKSFHLGWSRCRTRRGTDGSRYSEDRRHATPCLGPHAAGTGQQCAVRTRHRSPFSHQATSSIDCLRLKTPNLLVHIIQTATGNIRYAIINRNQLTLKMHVTCSETLI